VLLLLLTDEDLHRGQGVVLPVHALGGGGGGGAVRPRPGADGVELVPLLDQLLRGRVRQLEGLARQSPVEPERTQDDWRGEMTESQSEPEYCLRFYRQGTCFCEIGA